MNHDLLFETNRFNLSVVKSHFINPCCFGEDCAAWLRTKLTDRGLEVTEPDQEDWGWYIETKYQGGSYFIGIGGNPDESVEDNNRGEWRITIEQPRSLWKKMTAKEPTSTDELTLIIHEIIRAEPDFTNVRIE